MGRRPVLRPTGKALAARVTEIAVQFRRAPLALFGRAGAPQIDPNVLAIRVQPDEGILLRFGAKVPGTRAEHPRREHGLPVRQLVRRRLARRLRDVAPRLHDRRLHAFTRGDEVVRAWEILDPIADTWHRGAGGPLHFYAAGSWGPPAADELLARDGREWRRP